MLISSFLFGLAHSVNLVLRFSGNLGAVSFQVLGAFVIGIGFAALRLRTNMIWGAILVHLLLDFCLAISQISGPLFPVVEGTVLLCYGLYLLRNRQTLEKEYVSSLQTEAA